MILGELGESVVLCEFFVINAAVSWGKLVCSA